jgi:hypothetical protein
MGIDLLQLADAVVDEPTFREFLRALASDWRAAEELEAKSPSNPYSPRALGWENWNYDAVIEASADWADASSEGLRFYVKPENPWQRIAQILAMGKLYE